MMVRKPIETVEEMLRAYPRWDIRSPTRPRGKWVVFPQYDSGVMGEGDTLLDALESAWDQMGSRAVEGT